MYHPKVETQRKIHQSKVRKIHQSKIYLQERINNNRKRERERERERENNHLYWKRM